MKFKGVTPMLNVSNIERSLAFYRDLLGFVVTSDERKIQEWRWAFLKNGGSEIMLSESGGIGERQAVIAAESEGRWPMILYFYPTDVVALHAELLAAKADVSELRLNFYGRQEFQLRDPDGHLCWFGKELEQ